MEFEMVLNKSKYRVQIEPGLENVKKVRINDIVFDVNMSESESHEPTNRVVTIDNDNYTLELLKHKLELGRAQFELRVNDRYAMLEAVMPHVHSQEFLQDSSDNIAAKAVPKGRGRGSEAQKTDRSERKTAAGGIYAPMPGRLVSLKVAVGDTVSAGQVVAILEAMKMENELKASTGGKVKSINYKQGENVSQDKPIMIIE
ncbi:MAG: acetyl-CoA carboxylase biotin carboxyl carrier protein subunit [Thermoplasmata archaeon]|nr:MAG: acetyl-CoA carboxylase biotin carboxyl carrier protein subunit [Thermoplasmata archaeon]